MNKSSLVPTRTVPYPIPGQPRVAFLRPLIDNPLISIGAFTYYDDPDGPEQFEHNNVLYHFDFIGDRLLIGKFCALATGVTFIMNGANHDMRGFSTYPFPVMGGGWQENFDLDGLKGQSKGDTIVGDDVWIGRNATIMPGATIGAGAIVAAGSIVSGDVPAYGIVAGNPARLVRYRFDEETIHRLMTLSWWDWPIAMISRYRPLIQGSDIYALEEASKELAGYQD